MLRRVVPSPGRIVLYKLTEHDAQQITAKRVGNAARAGDILPMVIVKVWASEPTFDSPVNGQVLLDGEGTLWVTSRYQGYDEGQWSDPLHQPATTEVTSV